MISEKWSFQKHWSKNKGLPQPYLTDLALASEKIAYVTGVQTSKEYLQVLATADALRAKKGLLVVQHQQPQKHYKELLRTGKARAQMVLMPDGEEYCTQDKGPQHHGMCGDDDHSEEGSAESDGGRHEGLLQELLQVEVTMKQSQLVQMIQFLSWKRVWGKRLKVPMQAWTTSPSRRIWFQVPLKWLQMRRKWFQLCPATPIFRKSSLMQSL